MQTLPRSGFGSGVVGAVQNPPAQPEKLPDQRLIKLSNIDLKDPDSNRRCAALLSERVHLNEQIDKFLEAEELKAEAALREEWESVKAEWRERQTQLDELHGKQGELLQRWNRAIQAKSYGSARWGDAKAARESLGRFASAEQIKAADGAIEKTRAEYEKAEQEEGELFAKRNRLTFLKPPLTQKLAELGVREIRLSAQLNHEEYIDPMYGLIIPPGVVL